MLASTLYVRVVLQDNKKGYMLLAGYDSKVVQRTCIQYTTLTAVTRSSLNEAVERLRKANSAAEVKDCTSPDIQKKLMKLFGETPTQQVPATFSNIGVGHYLP
jgi:hypothetical protein